MRIKVLHFQVTERYVLRDSWPKWIWQRLFGNPDPDQYHFDVRMRVQYEQLHPGKDHFMELKKNDIIELPNKVKLIVWSVDRGNIIKAKTYKFIVEDLRGYHPDEIYLNYQRAHGHLNG